MQLVNKDGKNKDQRSSMMKDLYLINSCNVSGCDARHISHCIMSNLSLLHNVPA